MNAVNATEITLLFGSFICLAAPGSGCRCDSSTYVGASNLVP